MNEFCANDREKAVRKYTLKRKFVIFTVTVLLCGLSLLWFLVNPFVPIIAIPLIICFAYVLDKALIARRKDVYGDAAKSMRAELIKACVAVIVLTVIYATVACIFSAIYLDEVLGTIENDPYYDSVGQAIDHVQSSGLEEKYDINVQFKQDEEGEKYAEAVFSPREGKADSKDFYNFEQKEFLDSGEVVVRLQAKEIEYEGQTYSYYVLDDMNPDTAIYIHKGRVRTSENGLVAYGLAVIFIGMAYLVLMGVVALIYAVAMIITLLVSEPYFSRRIKTAVREEIYQKMYDEQSQTVIFD